MFYKLPIDFYGFFQKSALSKNKKKAKFFPEFDKTSSLKESIDRFIELIVFTHPGECKFAYHFGFEFWEMEFKNISIDAFNSTEYPRMFYEKGLEETIEKYESRLNNVKVEIMLSDIDAFFFKTRIKYIVSVNVQGNIRGLKSDPYNKTVVFSVGPVITKYNSK